MRKKVIAAVFAVLCIFYIIFSSRLFHAEEVVFTSVSIDAPDEVYIGEYFSTTITIGGASSETVEKSSFSIIFNNSDLEFTNFEDGEYRTTLPSGEDIIYTMHKNDGYITIETNDISNGDTIILDLRCKFNESNIKNGDVVHIVIQNEGNELISTDVRAKADVDWNHSKTGPSSMKVIDNGEKSLSGSYSYTVEENGSSSPVLDSDPASFKVVDTITLPLGMSFKETAEDCIKQALNIGDLPGLTFEEISSNKVVFSWAQDISEEQYSYNMCIDNDCFVFDDLFDGTDILTNEISTTVTTELGSDIILSPQKVETSFEIINEETSVKDFKKEIVGTDSWNLSLDGSGYVIQNNVVLYQISFKNNTTASQDYVLKDIIPDGMRISTSDEISILNLSTYEGAIGSSSNSPHTLNGNEIIWEIKGISPDETVKAWVYLTVEDNKEGTLTNTASMDDLSSSVTINQQKDNAKVSISKRASYNGVSPGKEFEYTISLWNDCNSVQTKDIVDEVPDCLEILDVYVSWKSDAVQEGEVVIEGNTLSVNGIQLDKQSGINYVVKVKINDNYEGNEFSNIAKLYDDGNEESQASVTNKGNNELQFVKSASKTKVRAGDTFDYIFTITNNNSDDIEVNDFIDDIFSDSFEITGISCDYDGVTISSVSSGDAAISVVGIIKAKTAVKVTVSCKVKDDAEEEVITNTAKFQDKESSVDVEITNESKELSVKKSAYLADGTEITDGHVSKGDKITFTVRMTNESEVAPISTLELFDLFNGKFVKEKSDGHMDITVKSSNVTGFVEDGTIITKEEVWGTNLYYMPITLLFSNIDTSAFYYNENFSIGPSGWIEVSYDVIIGDDFIDGKNEVTLNNDFHDEIELTSQMTPTIEIQKSAAIHNYTMEELDNTIDYTIKIFNTSDNDGYFNEFEITDTLPDGLEFVPAYWGASHPNAIVKLNDITLWDWWLDTLGGHYNLHIEGNNITFQFGTTSESGKYTPLNFNKGSVITITFPCRFTEEKKEELRNSNSSTYPIASFTNTSILKSDEDFFDFEGNKASELSSEDTIFVVPESPHPGINKQFLGAYLNGDNEIFDIPAAGDSLLWEISVQNEANDGSCMTMNDFSVYDVLPENYVFDDEYANKIEKIDKDGNRTEIPWFEPVVEGNKITWNFEDAGLNNHEKLIITIGTKSNGINKYATFINRAGYQQENVIWKDTISAGEQKDDYTIESTAQTSSLLYKTSSYMTVEYYPTGEHRNEPEYGIGISYSQDNCVYASNNANVLYTMHMTNESSIPLNGLSFVARMPYVGDSGILSGYDRNSSFNIAFNGLVSANLITDTGEKIDISDKITISFSDQTGKLNEDFSTCEWHDEYRNGDINVMFYVDGVEVNEMDSIEISFNGFTPDYSTDDTAWANFAYSYTSVSDVLMTAEPAKVGVKLQTIKQDGNIELTKKYTSASEREQTFYFSLFIEENNTMKRYYAVEPLTIRGGESGIIIFSGLPYGTYYIYETDQQGNILEKSSIIGQGTEVEVIDSETVYTEIENVDILSSIHIIKSDNYDGTLLKGAEFEIKNTETSVVYTAVSDEKGVATVNDVSPGTYEITEVKAPEGYYLLRQPIIIDVIDETVTVEIKDVKKMYMPATGGGGNILFFTIGIIIIISCSIIIKCINSRK